MNISPWKTVLAGLALSLAAMTSVQASQAGSSGGTHWGYSGNIGPEYWGSLGYPACAQGKNQSPVDLAKSASVPLDAISFAYDPSTIQVVNNGHTVQFNYDPGSSMTVGGKRYDLLQFHFHSPSEDTVEGSPYDMQLHLVHKSTDGRLAVVGVFLKAENSDSFGRGHDSEASSMDVIFGALPGLEGLTLSGNLRINASDLIPHDRKYWHFMGSLTTPPCSEGVAWFVMQEPMAITPQQLARFRSIHHDNARPVQPWNARTPLERVNGDGHSSGH